MKKADGNGKDSQEETHVEETLILEKATHVALASYHQCKCSPFRDTDGRVRFEVKGRVSEALAEIQNNSFVKIGDYLAKLEAVRSLIFSLKARRTAAL